MKTRHEIYSHEATELLKLISSYETLLIEQIYRFFNDKKPIISFLIKKFVRDGRIYTDQTYVSINPKLLHDRKIIKSFWILLDFAQELEYHFQGEFPTSIVFFSGGELYEIIYMEKGYEAIIEKALSYKKNEESNKIIVVDEIEQIHTTKLNGIKGYCTVDETGTIQYYTKEDHADGH